MLFAHEYKLNEGKENGKSGELKIKNLKDNRFQFKWDKFPKM